MDSEPRHDGWRPGDRVVLKITTDPYTRLRPGDTGTVVRVRGAEVDVAWDSGSTLSMLLDAGDAIGLLVEADAERECPNCGTPTRKADRLYRIPVVGAVPEPTDQQGWICNECDCLWLQEDA